MPIKKNYALTVLDSKMISAMNRIIIDHANITMQSSSHMYFDTQPVDFSEIAQDITFFQLEAEDKNDLDKKLHDLLEDLNQIKVDYALRDEDTGEMIVYVKFVGALDIKFDNVEIIKEGTYKKIDELKHFKTELGTCKGYKPAFRPVESQPIKDMVIKPESIYLFCHSKEDLLKLKEILSEKIMEIDSSLEIGFRLFTEDDLE